MRIFHYSRIWHFHQIPRFFLIYLDPNRSKIHAFLAKLHVEEAGKRQPLLEAPPRPLVLVHAVKVLGHNLIFVLSLTMCYTSFWPYVTGHHYFKQLFYWLYILIVQEMGGRSCKMQESFKRAPLFAIKILFLNESLRIPDTRWLMNYVFIIQQDL